jgi:hypothetical protein
MGNTMSLTAEQSEAVCEALSHTHALLGALFTAKEQASSVRRSYFALGEAKRHMEAVREALERIGV